MFLQLTKKKFPKRELSEEAHVHEKKLSFFLGKKIVLTR
jgi:hypothetical protein